MLWLDVPRGPISFSLVVRKLPRLLLVLEIAMLLLVFLRRQLLLGGADHVVLRPQWEVLLVLPRQSVLAGVGSVILQAERLNR